MPPPTPRSRFASRPRQGRAIYRQRRHDWGVAERRDSGARVPPDRAVRPMPRLLPDRHQRATAGQQRQCWRRVSGAIGAQRHQHETGAECIPSRRHRQLRGCRNPRRFSRLTIQQIRHFQRQANEVPKSIVFGTSLRYSDRAPQQGELR